MGALQVIWKRTRRSVPVMRGAITPANQTRLRPRSTEPTVPCFICVSCSMCHICEHVCVCVRVCVQECRRALTAALPVQRRSLAQAVQISSDMACLQDACCDELEDAIRAQLQQVSCSSTRTNHMHTRRHYLHHHHHHYHYHHHHHHHHSP